jgi:membrane-associated phospholipid phosphatase
LSTSYPRIDQYTSIGADIFVFLYPIFLVALYLKGIIKKEKESKEGALFIFFSCLFCTLINIGIQRFFYKQRPNAVLYDDTEETMLHQFLPESSFPSDHAVVSMSFALATLFRGYKVKNKKIIFAGYVFIVISLVMCLCRIFTVVHWPSDIL